ncbi:ATP-binding protein [candidate division CSSED10-310 bacterium]|uniref:ATP-binding protein n=1 Tax=candidate division CSSED10-310 bacterium TaxID=2855610 RepID=A0ABV6YXN4_UNCC1
MTVKKEIAIASGKGGTGKTTVAVNIAACWDDPVILADCDVEEPNAHLFIQPTWDRKKPVTVLNPEFNMDLCDGTGACRDVCRYNAIIVLGKSPLLFPELCHSCGGCYRACPNNAITEVPREIGYLECGHRDKINFIHGRMNIGEAKSPPLIKAVRTAAREQGENLVIIDAPPGTTCPVIEATRKVDYLVLVTEPTPFGLSDLKLARETAQIMDIRHGVIVNRSDLGNNDVFDYCRQENIPILASIPFEKKAAQLYSQSKILVKENSHYQALFRNLFQQILKDMEQ